MLLVPSTTSAETAVDTDLRYWAGSCMRSYDVEENLFGGGESDWDECDVDGRTRYVVNVIREAERRIDRHWGRRYQRFARDLRACVHSFVEGPRSEDPLNRYVDACEFTPNSNRRDHWRSIERARDPDGESWRRGGPLREGRRNTVYLYDVLTVIHREAGQIRVRKRKPAVHPPLAPRVPHVQPIPQLSYTCRNGLFYCPMLTPAIVGTPCWVNAPFTTCHNFTGVVSAW